MFRFIGHVVFYGIIIPKAYNSLARPMLIDWVVENKADRIPADVLKKLRREQEEMNTPGFQKSQ